MAASNAEAERSAGPEPPTSAGRVCALVGGCRRRPERPTGSCDDRPVSARPALHRTFHGLRRVRMKRPVRHVSCASYAAVPGLARRRVRASLERQEGAAECGKETVLDSIMLRPCC
jgi:hypothetical protein